MTVLVTAASLVNGILLRSVFILSFRHCAARFRTSARRLLRQLHVATAQVFMISFK